MKKLLIASAVAAGLFAGTHGVQAAPIITLTLSTAGLTSGQCAAGSGGELSSFSGDTCTITSTNGVAGFGNTFINFQMGNFLFNNEAGFGAPILTQPSLWLRTNATSASAGVLTITLVAQGYTTPLGGFALDSTASGTVDRGSTVNIADYFDASNSGVAGAGTLLYGTTWTGFASGSAPGGNVPVNVTNNGAYGESWIETITATGRGQTTGINGTLIAVPLPSPTPLSLLGFGLVALGLVTRRRRFQN